MSVGAWYISRSELIKDACQNFTTSIVMMRLRSARCAIRIRSFTYEMGIKLLYRMINVKMSSTNCRAVISSGHSCRRLTLVPGDLTLKIPILGREEPLNVSKIADALISIAYLSDTASDSRDDGQNQQQDEKVQDLPVDLSLDRCSFDRRIAGISTNRLDWAIPLTLHYASTWSHDQR